MSHAAEAGLLKRLACIMCVRVAYRSISRSLLFWKGKSDLSRISLVQPRVPTIAFNVANMSNSSATHSASWLVHPSQNHSSEHARGARIGRRLNRPHFGLDDRKIRLEILAGALG